MTSKDGEMKSGSPPPIYIVSGGVGASGEQLVHTLLAQFPENRVPVITVGNVRQVDQIERVVAQARETGGTVAHTLVDADLRQALISLAREQEVVEIDLIGPLVARMKDVLGEEPLGQPGLYRKLHREYFERVAAMEFTMAHDDGKISSGWPQADIVLTGVSRTGKTPLSLYLSVLGWKVANVPFVSGMPPPEELFQLDPRRVIGLTIEPGQLLMHRQQRQRRLGVSGSSSYTEPEKIYDEIEEALRFFRRAGFAVIDVTDKPIETSADEIIRLITREIGSEDLA